ncbi:hypothetical protein F511_47606 [Dorcoceras hygrometricum]|uniref:Uncharacterized protein n=1 Tax=Dorcoceras hygrometricum TaxID=472368 RepID=A0A2Z6ZR63_9LAMI|nr:hypothetical protein F511_47606 [Dorcoceras hygrometricum]
MSVRPIVDRRCALATTHGRERLAIIARHGRPWTARWPRGSRMLADGERLCAPLLVAREAAERCAGGALLLRRLCDDGWPMSAAVGAAVPRAWRDVARGCHAIFRLAPPPAGRRSGDVVTADFF